MIKKVSQRAWNRAIERRTAAAGVIHDAVTKWQAGHITTRSLLITIAENITAPDACDDEIANVDAVLHATWQMDQTR